MLYQSYAFCRNWFLVILLICNWVSKLDASRRHVMTPSVWLVSSEWHLWHDACHSPWRTEISCWHWTLTPHICSTVVCLLVLFHLYWHIRPSSQSHSSYHCWWLSNIPDVLQLNCSKKIHLSASDRYINAYVTFPEWLQIHDFSYCCFNLTVW